MRSLNTLKGYPPFCSSTKNNRTKNDISSKILRKNFYNETFCPKGGVQITLKTKTLISNNIYLKIIKRYHGPVKKTVEKCVGLACNSTRPFMEALPAMTTNPSQPTGNSLSSTSTQPTQQEPVKPNLGDTEKVLFPKPMILAPKSTKEIYAEVCQVKATVKGSSAPDQSKMNSVVNEYQNTQEVTAVSKIVKQTRDNSIQDTCDTLKGNNNIIKDVIGLPSRVSEGIPDMNSLEVPFMAKITLEYDSEGIMYPIPNPPPLPQTKPVMGPTKTLGNFCDQILGLKPGDDNTNIKPSQVKAALLELEKRNLLHYINDQEKLSKDFYKFYKKQPEQFITLEIKLDNLYKNNNLKVGLLHINDMENTVLLNGIQSHVVVLYTEQYKLDIILGFFTSDKTSGIKLSSEQPFVYENKQKDKGQYYTMLQDPLVIKDPTLLKLLDNVTLSTGDIMPQQKIGDDYINQDVIKGILLEHLKFKLVNEKTPKGIYDGKGITLVDIENTIKVFDLQVEIDTKNLLLKYIKKKNEQNVEYLNKWLQRQQQTLDNISFERLKQKIEEYENKFK